MRYILIATLLVTALYACVDRYDFLVENENPGYVIEGYISDKSYFDIEDIPADGRYFTVKISKTSDVINVRNKAVSGAFVTLRQLGGKTYNYQEDHSKAGTYYNPDATFKAIPGETYQLEIYVDGHSIKSEFISLPDTKTTISEIGIKETTLPKYVYIDNNERKLEQFPGINLIVHTPKKETDEKKYYKWSFNPTWIYIAPNTEFDNPYRTCWVTSDHYLNGYSLYEDHLGNTPQEITYVQTLGNEKVYEYLSLLVHQYEMNQGFYTFHKDLKNNFDRGGLYDQLPYNLSTNFKVNSEDNIQVIGYFDAVNEDVVRWTFNPDDISYPIVNNLKEICAINYGPPAPGEYDQCDRCTSYNDGIAVNYPPNWW